LSHSALADVAIPAPPPASSLRHIPSATGKPDQPSQALATGSGSVPAAQRTAAGNVVSAAAAAPPPVQLLPAAATTTAATTAATPATTTTTAAAAAPAATTTTTTAAAAAGSSSPRPSSRTVPNVAQNQDSPLIKLLYDTRQTLLSHLTPIRNTLAIDEPPGSTPVPTVERHRNGDIRVLKFLIEDTGLLDVFAEINKYMADANGYFERSMRKYTATNTLFTRELPSSCEQPVNLYKQQLEELNSLNNAISKMATFTMMERITTEFMNTIGVDQLVSVNPASIGSVSPILDKVVNKLKEIYQSFEMIHAQIEQFHDKVSKLEDTLKLILDCVSQALNEKTKQIGQVLEKSKRDHASIKQTLDEMRQIIPP
jgi:archaellum component FlaC